MILSRTTIQQEDVGKILDHFGDSRASLLISTAHVGQIVVEEVVIPGSFRRGFQLTKYIPKEPA